MRFLWLVVALSACTVGEDAPQNKQPDAPAGAIDAPSAIGDGPALDAPATTTDAGFACRDKVLAVGDGHHNAGMNCMDACHNHGFTAAGTIFTTAAGTTPVIGATITLIDATGRILDIPTQQNGNFYTTTAFTPPLTAWASSCPNQMMMTAPIPGPAPIGCNRAGCHTAGNRIHLP